jgi:outer membrane protein assembly factor BamD (BamD/ComL family)
MAKPADRRFRPGRAGVLVAAVALAVAPGCQACRSFKERVTVSTAKLLGSNYDDPLAESRIQEAKALYEAGDYEQAMKLFRTLADNKGNAAVLAEEARFMQAECRYARGQYPEAADTYHKVLIDFPTGTYRRQCCERMFQICDYWLDDFRDELERRSGEKGVLRWRPRWPDFRDSTKPVVDQEGRTLENLERIHTHGVNDPIADKAIFWCGYVNFIRGNFQEADQFFSQLVDMHGDSPLRPQAMAFAIQAKNNATGGARYDGRKCAEALHLVHVAEASVPELINDPLMAEKLTRAKFAIRSQQAEKDFLQADYYERTGHPGSAVFYYELVRRRYAGTRYSDLATERQARLITLMKDGHPDPGTDPFAIAKAKWHQLFGKPNGLEEKDRPRVDPSLMPAGGAPTGSAPAGITTGQPNVNSGAPRSGP